jgi:3-hydroxybutyryl-CoA dehydrogenase
LISRISIVGGGLMGSGIAQVVAQAGFEATIVDVDAEALARSLARIQGGYARLSTKGALTDADAAAALARVHTTTSLEEAADSADHVIETVVEDLEVKKDVLRRLGELCRDDVILATNTSQFSISALAAASGRPDRMIGSHWFNPAPVMRLIEIVRGVETSDETLAVALDLAERYGKETVVCRKDAPGFITSRLIALLMIEAARLVDEGIASVEDVNRACVLAFNHAQGPLDTADLSGLDTIERIGTALAAQYGERFLPPNALRSLVNAGHYGRKTGRGFSTYRDPS